MQMELQLQVLEWCKKCWQQPWHKFKPGEWRCSHRPLPFHNAPGRPPQLCLYFITFCSREHGTGFVASHEADAANRLQPLQAFGQEIDKLLRFWSSTFKVKVKCCLQACWPMIDFSWQLVEREVQHPTTKPSTQWPAIVQPNLNFASNVNDPVWQKK